MPPCSMNRSRNRSGRTAQRLKKSARSVAMTQTSPVRIMVRIASQSAERSDVITVSSKIASN